MSICENAKLWQLLRQMNLWVKDKCIFCIVPDTRMRYSSKAADDEIFPDKRQESFLWQWSEIRQKINSCFNHSCESFQSLYAAFFERILNNSELSFGFCLLFVCQSHFQKRFCNDAVLCDFLACEYVQTSGCTSKNCDWMNCSSSVLEVKGKGFV